jgi:hypothetical protein
MAPSWGDQVVLDDAFLSRFSRVVHPNQPALGHPQATRLSLSNADFWESKNEKSYAINRH